MFDNTGRRCDDERFTEIRRELTERFGGVTAYLRSPAAGLWQRDDGSVDRDEMVMIEVMIESMDDAWWADYRARLEHRFSQETIVLRALAIRLL